MTQADRVFGILTVVASTVVFGLMAVRAVSLRRISRQPREQWRALVDALTRRVTLAVAGLLALFCILGWWALVHDHPDEGVSTGCVMTVGYLIAVVSLGAWFRAEGNRALQRMREDGGSHAT